MVHSVNGVTDGELMTVQIPNKKIRTEEDLMTPWWPGKLEKANLDEAGSHVIDSDKELNIAAHGRSYSVRRLGENQLLMIEWIGLDHIEMPVHIFEIVERIRAS